MSSSGRSLSSQFAKAPERKYRHVRLQVYGETMWIHRVAKDGEYKVEDTCLKRYTLPALLSSPSYQASEGNLLKLGFLNGEIIIVKAKTETDWGDLMRCLGPVSFPVTFEARKLWADE